MLETAVQHGPREPRTPAMAIQQQSLKNLLPSGPDVLLFEEASRGRQAFALYRTSRSRRDARRSPLLRGGRRRLRKAAGGIRARSRRRGRG